MQMRALPSTSLCSPHGVGPLDLGEEQNGCCGQLRSLKLFPFLSDVLRGGASTEERGGCMRAAGFPLRSVTSACPVLFAEQCHGTDMLTGQSCFSLHLVETDSICPLLLRSLGVLVTHTCVWRLAITVRVLHLPSRCYGRVTACW